MKQCKTCENANCSMNKSFEVYCSELNILMDNDMMPDDDCEEYKEGENDL